MCPHGGANIHLFVSQLAGESSAIGEELAEGSPWVAVDKKLASHLGWLGFFIKPQVAFVVA